MASAVVGGSYSGHKLFRSLVGFSSGLRTSASSCSDASVCLNDWFVILIVMSVLLFYQRLHFSCFDPSSDQTPLDVCIWS